MNQISKIITIIIIIMIKKRIKRKNIQMKGDEASGAERRDIFIFIFLLFTSFSDLRKSDHRFSSGLKVKLIHATRATSRYQNLGVSSNSTR